jgi:hypothetical protein
VSHKYKDFQKYQKTKCLYSRNLSLVFHPKYSYAKIQYSMQLSLTSPQNITPSQLRIELQFFFSRLYQHNAKDSWNS